MKTFKGIAAGLLLLTLCTACRHKPVILPEDDYITFVRQILTAAYGEHPDPSVFTEAFDKKAFAERIMSQGDIPETMRPDVDRFLEEYFQPGRMW